MQRPAPARPRKRRFSLALLLGLAVVGRRLRGAVTGLLLHALDLLGQPRRLVVAGLHRIEGPALLRLVSIHRDPFACISTSLPVAQGVPPSRATPPARPAWRAARRSRPPPRGCAPAV